MASRAAPYSSASPSRCSPVTGSRACQCTTVAPAAAQRTASSAHSCGVYGTCGFWTRMAASLRPTSMTAASRSMFGPVVAGVGQAPAHVLARGGLAGVLVQPGVEAVGALPVGHRAGNGRELVVGVGQGRVVAGGLPGQHLLDDGLESAGLLGPRGLVPLEELGQHLAPEQLEAFHDVLVAVA